MRIITVTMKLDGPGHAECSITDAQIAAALCLLLDAHPFQVYDNELDQREYCVEDVELHTCS